MSLKMAVSPVVLVNIPKRSVSNRCVVLLERSWQQAVEQEAENAGTNRSLIPCLQRDTARTTVQYYLKQARPIQLFLQ